MTWVCASCFVRDNLTDIDRNLLGKLEVNIRQDLGGVRFVDDRVITVLDFEGYGWNEVDFLVRQK
jgi:hypothetical protein